MSYIDPPARIPLLLRFLLRMVEGRMGRKLVAQRILSWFPKALLGSGFMESLTAHDEPEVPRRLLSLVRIYTSFLVSCPFCIDLNAREFLRKGITEREICALQGKVPMDEVPTLTPKERTALRYVDCMCRTPVAFPAEAVENMNAHFTPRGFVILASTCAQVNFWTRLIQSVGVPPAGFSDNCELLHLDDYATLQPVTSPAARLTRARARTGFGRTGTHP